MGSVLFWPVLLSVAGGGAVTVFLLYRVWAQRARLSPEERREIAATPMPKLQKRAGLSLALGVLTLGTISAILTVRGAAEYWDNDDLRTLVVGIFLAGLATYVSLLVSMVGPGASGDGLDERDRDVLGRAPMAQSAMILVALAIWFAYLTQHFRDQGTVPVVYLYLTFGLVVLVNWIGHSAGILLGYRMENRFGEG